MTDSANDVARINAITVNARNTWFVLLGVLAFVGITLLSVEHIDFYGVDRQTRLPLVGVEIPTRFFFYSAPVLVAAIFGYFHLYLLKLWDALSNAQSPDDEPLGDAITPWLISDGFLYRRNWLREDNSSTRRTLDGLSVLFNVVLAWGFGLAVLFGLWWQSMTARELGMSSVAGTALALSLFIGCASLAVAELRARQPFDGQLKSIFSTVPAMCAMLICIVAMPLVTFVRVQGDVENLAPINLVGESLTERPVGWLPYKLAKAEYRDAWCSRKQLAECSEIIAPHDQFEIDWLARRSAELADVRRPDWSAPGRRILNLNGANFSQGHLVGVWLEKALLEDADFYLAQMEGANFRSARLNRAEFESTSLEGADFQGAYLEDAEFVLARLEGADFGVANLSRADFEEAKLYHASFSFAQLHEASFVDADMRIAHLDEASLIQADFTAADLSGASFIRSSLKGASLGGAKAVGADFRAANMKDTDLLEAELHSAKLQYSKMVGTYFHATELQGADLSQSRIFGTEEELITMRRVNLSSSINDGGALRFVDLSLAVWDDRTDFRNVFLDGTVTVTDEFRLRMGEPCQWLDEPLSDAEFLSIWRWWLQQAPQRRGDYFHNNRDLYSSSVPTDDRLEALGLKNCSWDSPFGELPVEMSKEVPNR